MKIAYQRICNCFRAGTTANILATLNAHFWPSTDPILLKFFRRYRFKTFVKAFVANFLLSKKIPKNLSYGLHNISFKNINNWHFLLQLCFLVIFCESNAQNMTLFG